VLCLDVLIGGSASRPLDFSFIFSSRLVLLLLPPLGFLIAPEEGRAIRTRWTGYSCCPPWSCLPPQSFAPHRHNNDVSFSTLYYYCSYFERSDVKHPDFIPAEIECIRLTVWRVFPIFKPEWAISQCQSRGFISNSLEGPKCLCTYSRKWRGDFVCEGNDRFRRCLTCGIAQQNGNNEGLWPRSVLHHEGVIAICQRLVGGMFDWFSSKRKRTPTIEKIWRKKREKWLGWWWWFWRVTPRHGRLVRLRDNKRIIPQCHCCMALDFVVLEFEWPSPSVLILPPCVSYQIVIARDSSECLVGARRCHTAVAMLNNSYKKKQRDVGNVFERKTWS